MIYWFTGQPSAGKTTLANKLVKSSAISKIIHIDGDDLRDIFQNKDYSETGRRRNIERAMDIARFMNEKGYMVVASLVSPYRDMREELKKSSSVIEIYVHTEEDRGRNHFHVQNYEPPIENFIEINTTNKSEDESFLELISKIYL